MSTLSFGGPAYLVASCWWVSSRARRDTVLVIMRWEGRGDLVVIWWWAGSRARLHTLLIVIWWCMVGEAW